MKQYRFSILLSTSLAAPFLAPSVLAQSTDISHNVFSQVGYAQAEQGSLSETTSKSILLTGYLKEVDHGKHPYTQAPFLERAASVTLAYVDVNSNNSFFGSSRGDVSALDVQYVTEEHWVVGGGFSRNKIEGVFEDDSTSLTVGRYLDDSSRVLLSYKDSDKALMWGDSSHTYTYGVEYKNAVINVRGSALTLDMKANRIDAPEGDSNLFSLDGEYHFTLGSSVTLGAQLVSGYDESQEYSVGLNHFVTRFFALGVEYTRHDPADKESIDTANIYTRLLF
jgi:hypothetical protein